MTKNVIVTDDEGNFIGKTYPKRARGLIKNGRAMSVSDCEIKLHLKDTHVTSVDMNDTEDIIMSKYIEFNAREFKVSEGITSHVGAKTMLSKWNGENVLAYQLGDWQWNWSQIECEKELDKNEDYTFRFEIVGGVEDNEMQTVKLVISFNEDENDLITYPLAKSEFKPKFSKDSENGIIRIFEVPFNSGESEKVKFVFQVMRAVTSILPVSKDYSVYDSLKDLTYRDWHTQWIAKNQANQTPNEDVNAIYALLDEIEDNIDDEDVIEDLRERLAQIHTAAPNNNYNDEADVEIDMQGAVMTASMYGNLLKKIDDLATRCKKVKIDMQGAVIGEA